MGPEFNGEKEDGRGRPTFGMEKMSITCKVRMMPEMFMRLKLVCNRLRISRESGIREGIILFLKKYGG